MKKLSDLMRQQNAIEEKHSEAALTDMATLKPTQSLVLFPGVLSGDKLIRLPEIETLMRYFYGGGALILAQTDYAEQLHDWAREEQYKADAQEHAMIYHVKTPFEDLTLDTYSNQFSGPLYVQVFRPAGTEYDVLTITCQWNDGLFRNDYYVVGVIANSADLEAIVKSIIPT